MIREVKREDIPTCVDLIRSSFMTVADEYGITKENAPRFTAFAISDDRLYWHMDQEHRPMFVAEESGVLCGYYSLLIQENGECELNNLAVLPQYRHRGIGKQLLEHSYTTAKNLGCHTMNIGKKTPSFASGMKKTEQSISEPKSLISSHSHAVI